MINVILPVLSHEAPDIPKFIKSNRFLLDADKFMVWVKSNKELSIGLPDNFNLIVMEDRSIYEAWNQAIDAIESRYNKNFWLCFVGLDDFLSQDFFNMFFNLKNKNKNNFYFGDGSFQSPSGIRIRKIKDHPSLFSNLESIKWDIFHPGSVQHSSIFINQRFSIKYKLAGDFEFYLRNSILGKIHSQKIHVNQVITSMTGISNRPRAKLIYIKEIKELEAKFNVKILDNKNIYIEKLKAFFLMSSIGSYIRKIYWNNKS